MCVGINIFVLPIKLWLPRTAHYNLNSKLELKMFFKKKSKNTAINTTDTKVRMAYKLKKSFRFFNLLKHVYDFSKACVWWIYTLSLVLWNYRKDLAY